MKASFYLRLLLLPLFALGLTISAALAQPGGGGPIPGGPTPVPVDAGVSVLLASGIGYGVRRLYMHHKSKSA